MHHHARPQRKAESYWPVYLGLATNERMDVHNTPYVLPKTLVVPYVIPNDLIASYIILNNLAVSYIIHNNLITLMVVSIFFSILSLPGNHR